MKARLPHLLFRLIGYVTTVGYAQNSRWLVAQPQSQSFFSYQSVWNERTIFGPFFCKSASSVGIGLPFASSSFLLVKLSLEKFLSSKISVDVAAVILTFWVSRGLRVAGVMTSAAQMSSNISISIGPCLIRSVDDYWHNIFTYKGTAELCLSA